MFLRITGVFALIGGILATWVAPKAIAWYFDPPAEFGVSCKAPIEWALAQLQKSQGIGILSGAVVGMLFFVVINKRAKNKIAKGGQFSK